MANFTSFQNVLPDPNNTIDTAGQSGGTVKGPGFKSVSVTSQEPYIQSKTNSGRILARSIAAHKWSAKITYNPMTREEFEPIHTFLLQRRGPMNPFFVSLPQYRTPRNSSFEVHCATNNGLDVNNSAGYVAGTTSMLLDGPNYTINADGTPSIGDMFNILGANSNHKKAYMVTRVETPDDYLTASGAPAANNVRVHFVPGLSRSVVDDDSVVFHNPLIKVIRTGNVEEYSLNTNNLYQFALNVEEVQ